MRLTDRPGTCRLTDRELADPGPGVGRQHKELGYIGDVLVPERGGDPLCRKETVPLQMRQCCPLKPKPHPPLCTSWLPGHLSFRGVGLPRVRHSTPTRTEGRDGEPRRTRRYRGFPLHPKSPVTLTTEPRTVYHPRITRMKREKSTRV